MGSDAKLIILDYDRYNGEVVPAVVAWLRTGEAPSWLLDAGDSGESLSERRRVGARLRDEPVDLARHCTWLGDDLRMRTDLAEAGAAARPMLTCTSVTCPERFKCPFQGDGQEVVTFLVQDVVEDRCLGDGQFLGRSVTPDFYTPVLDRLAVPADDPLRALLAALGRRGGVIGYVFERTSGIRGWLTPAETAELAERLDRLDLPRYAPTFEAMRARWRDSMTAMGNQDWRAVSMSFVRTVARIAAAEGKAVLWGADVDRSGKP
ncbi:hypothetical protein [Actinoplanes sp. NBRC 103695]|uniref:hypothetical protein n=1 Tax=Actinoplanes sp. NBRC 103695 TaxID=3032202 RepID=UPI0024A21C44|nr:hypothetical protein [Actinoplanes sp. NBRC 103695]GLY95600.1 hypothetical protein Acsp02_28550 [Actinoplanes sp. NBRC 103695]